MKTYLSYALMLGGLLVLASGSAHAETLAEAMAKAYRGNPGLEAQRAQQRAIDEQVDQAQAGYKPRVNGVAQVGRNYFHTPKSQMLPEDSALSSKSLGLEVSQPLFSGFRTLNGVDAAEKQVLAGRAMLQAGEQQLLLNVGKSYLDVLRDRAMVELYKHNEEVLSLRATETQKRFAIGEVTQTDVLQSEARWQGTKTGLTQAQGQLESDTAAYLRYIGDAPENLEEPKLKLDKPATRDEAVEAAIHGNPLVIAATYSEDKALADVAVARGAFLPQLDLVGGISRSWEQSDFIPGQRDSTSIMLRMTIPIYNAGVDYSQTRAAHATAAQRRMELEEIRLAVRQAAVAGWNGLQTARAAVASSEAQVKADERALEGVKKENAAGTRTTLDILNAEQELLAARLAFVQARHDEAMAVLQVRAAVGTLTAEALALPLDGAPQPEEPTSAPTPAPASAQEKP